MICYPGKIHLGHMLKDNHLCLSHLKILCRVLCPVLVFTMWSLFASVNSSPHPWAVHITKKTNTSQLAAFSLLSLRSYKLFQCDEIIVSFFLLQFLCITKPQGRIFTMKTWALCITRPALCFSTQDWSCKVYITLTNILTPTTRSD